MSSKKLFVRPRRKDDDDDSDDEYQRHQKRSRRTMEVEQRDVASSNRASTLESAVAAIVSQIQHPQRSVLTVPEVVAPPATDDSALERLSAVTLKPFQRDGVRWMIQQSHTRGLGVVLADEMGCGKTIQTLVTYLALREASAVAARTSKRRLSPEGRTGRGGGWWDDAFTMLVIAPLSVNPTWEREILHVTRSKHDPHAPTSGALRVLRYGGSRDDRAAIIDRVEADVLSRRRRDHQNDDDESDTAATSRARNGGKFRQNVVDVIITTPEYILSDSFFLAKLHYEVLVVDEAHRLKNAESLLYRCLRDLYVPRTRYRFLLTGTPLSNLPSDLWNLLALVNPAYLRQDIPRAAGDDATAAGGSDASPARQAVAFFQNDRNRDLLKQLTSLLVLRRLKKDVLGFLPPVTEVVVQVPLSPLQLRLYATILRKDVELLSLLMALPTDPSTTTTRTTHATAAQVSTARRTSLLNVVVQLRKCCNHPYLFSGVEPEPFVNGEHLVTASGKLAVLDVLLKKLAAEGHRVLIFSQFTATLDILQDYLTYRRFTHVRLDGSVRGELREDAVQAFQFCRAVEVDNEATSFSCEDEGGGNDETDAVAPGSASKHVTKQQHRQRPPFVFLLSTRAGGVGLTLTAADTVIFFDHDWNPMMDRQAQERVHRIGQDKPVTIYRLCTQHTVEETMLLVASKKSRVAQDILQGVEESALWNGSGGLGAAANRGGDEESPREDETDLSEKLSAAALRNLIRLGVAALPASTFSPTCTKSQIEEQEALWKSAVAALNIENLLVVRETSHPLPAPSAAVVAPAARDGPNAVTAAAGAKSTSATTLLASNAVATTLEDALAVQEQEEFKASLTVADAVLKGLYEGAIGNREEVNGGRDDGKRKRRHHRDTLQGEQERGVDEDNNNISDNGDDTGGGASRARRPANSPTRPRSVDADRILRSRKKWRASGYFSSALPLDGELLHRCVQLCSRPSQVRPPEEGTTTTTNGAGENATTASLPLSPSDEVPLAAEDPAAVFLAESFSHWARVAWPSGPSSFFFSAVPAHKPASDAYRDEILGESDEQHVDEAQFDGLQHVKGDLFHPIADLPTTLRIAIVPVNNSGTLGSGRMFDAVRALCPNAAAQYLAAKDNGDLRMGDVHLLWTRKHPTTLQVALVVIQKSSTADRSTGGDVDLKALGHAMERLRWYVQSMTQCRAASTAPTAVADGSDKPRSAPYVTLHFPQFTALSKEAAYALDKTLVKHLAEGTRCYCYHVSRRSLHPQPLLLLPSPPPRARDEAVGSRAVQAEDEVEGGFRGGQQRQPAISAADCFFVFWNPTPSDAKSAVARKVLTAGGVFLTPESALSCVRSGEILSSQLVILLDDNDGDESAALGCRDETLRAFLSQSPEATVTSVGSCAKLLFPN